jgi:hypothetical protein
MSEKIYSFSRLETFNTCKRQFYYSYIEKLERKQNIYGFIGTRVHEILENLQQKNITTTQALEIFESSLIDAELNGYTWLNENVQSKYVNSIKHYILNYTPIRCDDFKIEEEFHIELNNHKITGFIDLYTITNNTINIYDYKTSSNFSKDLPKKMRQLVLYGIALNQKYPSFKIDTLNFDMLKYYKQPSKRSKQGYTLKERSSIELFDFETKENAYLSANFEQEIVDETISYITTTINNIESLDENIQNYEKSLNPEQDFFCKTLCSFKDICLNTN